MKLIVNGVHVTHAGSVISYREVVGLSGLRGNPTVTYTSKRDDNNARREGSMYDGQSISVEPEMRFAVTHTNNA